MTFIWHRSHWEQQWWLTVNTRRDVLPLCLILTLFWAEYLRNTRWGIVWCCSGWRGDMRLSGGGDAAFTWSSLAFNQLIGGLEFPRLAKFSVLRACTMASHPRQWIALSPKDGEVFRKMLNVAMEWITLKRQVSGRLSMPGLPHGIAPAQALVTASLDAHAYHHPRLTILPSCKYREHAEARLQLA